MADIVDPRPTILVFEDDAELLVLFEDLFIEEGYRVSAHDRYLDDLGAVAALNPHLILLDMLVPGPISGLQYISALKTDPRTARIPVCPCTAASHLHEEIALALTAFDCHLVCKPFDLDELLAELTRCLAQQAGGARRECSGT